MILGCVMVGGALGAVGRWQIDRLVSEHTRGPIPYGTLTVNMLGCFLLGMVFGIETAWLRVLLGTGLCGALTTYSTFAVQGVQLARRRHGVAHVALHVVGGLALAALGMWLVT
ncbi:MAG: CrcB family protein [Flaviflexus sp.]|nr:CrcB family protein [Flaviflexus sp.]